MGGVYIILLCQTEELKDQSRILSDGCITGKPASPKSYPIIIIEYAIHNKQLPI